MFCLLCRHIKVIFKLFLYHFLHSNYLSSVNFHPKLLYQVSILNASLPTQCNPLYTRSLAFHMVPLTEIIHRHSFFYWKNMPIILIGIHSLKIILMYLANCQMLSKSHFLFLDGGHCKIYPI